MPDRKTTAHIFGFILVSQYIYATAMGGYSEPKKEIANGLTKEQCWHEARSRMLHSRDKFTIYSCEPDDDAKVFRVAIRDQQVKPQEHPMNKARLSAVALAPGTGNRPQSSR